MYRLRWIQVAETGPNKKRTDRSVGGGGGARFSVKAQKSRHIDTQTHTHARTIYYKYLYERNEETQQSCQRTCAQQVRHCWWGLEKLWNLRGAAESYFFTVCPMRFHLYEISGKERKEKTVATGLAQRGRASGGWGRTISGTYGWPRLVGFIGSLVGLMAWWCDWIVWMDKCKSM